MNDELRRHLERDDPRRHLDPGVYRAQVIKTEWEWSGERIRAIHYSIPVCGDWQWRIDASPTVSQEFLQHAHEQCWFDFERGTPL